MHLKTSNEAIKSLVATVILTAEHLLAENLESIFIMGSLARGGFSESTSDIDVGIILKQVTADSNNLVEQIRAHTLSSHPTIENNLSIFWGSVESINSASESGRYPPFDRLDLIDHGVLLFGQDARASLVQPTKPELDIASAKFALDYLASPRRIIEFRNSGLIAMKDVVYITKTILFPARFIYLAELGEVAGNDTSSEFYCRRFSGPDADLVKLGFLWRSKELPPTEEIEQYLAQGLIPLYSRFIGIYEDKMENYGEKAVKNALADWRHQLLD